LIPQIPPIPPGRGFEAEATAELRPRYEDISQDGRVHLTSLVPGLGVVWRSLSKSGLTELFPRQGILPVLQRAVFVGEKGPFSVSAPIHTTGSWRLASEEGGDRIFLDMWLEARAPTGLTYGPTPPTDAPLVLVGRVYAAHVLTRPFAATPADRKVTRIDVPGLPPRPEDARPYEDADALVAGRTLTPATEHTFGMMHTDSNQHVNSLVYPRLFEEAVLRHLLERPLPSLTVAPHLLMARAIELRWRKPFFAGERATIALDVAEHDGGAFCVGAFGHPRPHCAIAAWLT
jgi:hypothetical protein